MCFTHIVYCQCCKKDLLTHLHKQCLEFDQCFTRKYYFLKSQNSCPSCVSHEDQECVAEFRSKSVTVIFSRKSFLGT